MPISPAFERYQDICPDWPQFLVSLEHPLPTTLWVNTRAISTAALFDLMEWRSEDASPFAWRSDAFRVPDHWEASKQPEYQAGFYHLQEEVSMIPPLLLDPQPGERILDMCAAPGNKTMQMALAMQNRGTIVAHDWNFNRLRILRSHSQRLGFNIVSTSLGNGIHFKGADGFFDRVLVDAPCSCEGTVRKNPRIMFHKQEPGTLLYNGVQLGILQKAIAACKAGGRIVYSTCTFRPEENEQVVDAILKQNPGLQIVPVSVPGLVHSPGLTHFDGLDFHADLRHALRIWPHQNDSGGFFICVLEKAAGQNPAYEFQTPAQRVAPENLPFLQDRFDFPASFWIENQIFHRAAKKLSYAPVPHHIPKSLKLQEFGQNFMKINFTFPKLSTAAARVLGHTARKNRVYLNRQQFKAYVAIEDRMLTEEESWDIEGPGYVLVFYAGSVVGLGLVQWLEGSYRLRSLFPQLKDE